MLTKWKVYKENIRLPIGIHDTYDAVTILLKKRSQPQLLTKVCVLRLPIFMLQNIITFIYNMYHG